MALRGRALHVVAFFTVFLACLLLGFFIFLGSSVVKKKEEENACTDVDVVYTWVNGSDPVHVKAKKRFPRPEDPQIEETGESGRDREYDTLRYSLRSLSFLPNVRLIHIVIADGEKAPFWLDTKHPKIRIVRHSQIMPKKVLPTFNSNGIETNLHRVPNLAPCFLYLNDDMLLGRAHRGIEAFWDAQKNVQKVHFGVWKAPMKEFLETSSWHKSVAKTNDRLSSLYGSSQDRYYPLHGCYFFNKRIFTEMREKFADSFEETLKGRYRSSADNVVSFLYPHFAMKEFGAVSGSYQVHYMGLSDNSDENIESLRLLVRRRPMCICINDNLGTALGVEHARKSLEDLHQALELMYPRAEDWEMDKNKRHPIRVDRSRFEGRSWLEYAFIFFMGTPVVIMAFLVCFGTLLQLWKKKNVFFRSEMHSL